MYDFYKYYVLIGFERYTHKIEISKETYNKLSDDGRWLIGSRRMIPTKNGFIEIESTGVNFIELFKL